MKKPIFLLLLISFSNMYSQNIFEYEREIADKEKYIFQEIEFENTDDRIKLFGTLITPKSDFDKIIIIVPGSGKDTRYSHPKMAEFFLKNNIGVYRFDERGVGKSGGDYSQKATTLKNDLHYCVNSLLSLDNIKNKKIGVLGHSLGGMASIGIFEYKPKIDFLIQMSTPVNAGQSFKSKVSELDIFKNRKSTIEEFEKAIDTFNYVIHSLNGYSKIKNECERLRKKMKVDKFISEAYLSPQIIDIVNLETELYYKNINIPMLYIIGKKDENIDVQYSILKLKEFDNDYISIEVLENFDHYLTQNNGKWSSSKKSIDREIDDIAMDKIINWVNRIKKN